MPGNKFSSHHFSFYSRKITRKNTALNVQKALCVHSIIQPPSAMRDDGFILAKRKIDFLTQEMKFSERTRERARENISIQSCTRSKLVKCLFFQLIYGKIIWQKMEKSETTYLVERDRGKWPERWRDMDRRIEVPQAVFSAV